MNSDMAEQLARKYAGQQKLCLSGTTVSVSFLSANDALNIGLCREDKWLVVFDFPFDSCDQLDEHYSFSFEVNCRTKEVVHILYY
jgi:hypothetical protein